MKKNADYDLTDPGWMNATELDWIAEHVKDSPGPVLEVGCYAGRTTRRLIEATKGMVYAVDPLWRNHHMPRWPTPDAVWIETREHMRALVAKHPSRLVVLPCFAEELSGLFALPLDVFLLDADHSYETTRDQIDLFAPFVKQSGVIILDDFDVEPVESAWRDSRYRAAYPWLAVERFESLALVRVTPEPHPSMEPQPPSEDAQP